MISFYQKGRDLFPSKARSGKYLRYLTTAIPILIAGAFISFQAATWYQEHSDIEQTLFKDPLTTQFQNGVDQWLVDLDLACKEFTSTAW